jgi:hypothetical protein
MSVAIFARDLAATVAGVLPGGLAPLWVDSRA